MHMCAIAGILDLPVSDGIQEAMLATMKRRGPDGKGQWSCRRGCLLHTRLAIIDPEGGGQPMTVSWQGETYTICYNGELYNTGELRRELEKEGHRFLGHSDTEVLLHGYTQWGEAVLDRLNGIYAFAVWEHGRERLFLARDRIGVKPLFYAEYRGGLLFASEIKTILAYPGFPRELDETGVAELVLMGPGRTPGCGVLRGISEMEPGTYGFYEEGHLKKTCYWRLRDREHREDFPRTCSHVRELLTDAIRRQMVSDVPIGIFLSGGLDSSLITAVCSREMEKQGRMLPTFSVDYLDNEKYFRAGKFQPNSDAPFITVMEEHFPLETHHTTLSPEELAEALVPATCARDLPGMADVDFSLLVFCGQIAKRVKVALSGECADEIFGGYPWYRDPEIRDREGFPWAQNLRQRQALLLPRWRDTLGDYAMDRYRETVSACDILPGTSPLERRMKEMVHLNLHWFMQTLLDRKDRMSMYWGLEVRVPFCDYRIAEYLYGVPWEMKNYKGREKGLLREAMTGLLPEQILWRKKSPYPKTFHPEYGRIMKEGMNRLLSDKNAPIWSLMDPNAAEKLTGDRMGTPWYGQLMREPQTMAYFLQMDAWLRSYRITVQ